VGALARAACVVCCALAVVCVSDRIPAGGCPLFDFFSNFKEGDPEGQSHPDVAAGETAQSAGWVSSLRRWDGDFLTAVALNKCGVLGRLVEFESHFDRWRAGLPSSPAGRGMSACLVLACCMTLMRGLGGPLWQALKCAVHRCATSHIRSCVKSSFWAFGRVAA
jgi:hypothetical protein